MKTNSLLEKRMANVPKDVQDSVNLSFDVVDRIHDILQAKGLTRKDLAWMLGKNESEISKWMRGTHNFTLSTITKIENALGEKILSVVQREERSQPNVLLVFSSQDFASFKVDETGKGYETTVSSNPLKAVCHGN